MAVLSIQGQFWIQSALAQTLSEAPVLSRAISQSSEAKSKLRSNPVSAQESALTQSPDTQKAWDDGDAGIFCCFTEILLLAGLVLIGVLGANLMMWLIEQNPRY